VVDIADIVNVSFVQDPSDIVRLHETLGRRGGDNLGIVLKIETRQAFERLPQLLLTAMRRPHVGVMIARGDLAVEVGYERLAELQEEILWLCEAAHLPVIWATQVPRPPPSAVSATSSANSRANASVARPCIASRKASSSLRCTPGSGSTG
jgi:pyruvate kinase